MSQQPFPYPPVTHRNDPTSSRDAADQHTISGRRDTNAGRVLDQLRRETARTSAEIHRDLELHDRAEGLHWNQMLDVYEVRRRLSDLARCGFAYRGEVRPCTVAGKAAATWHLEVRDGS